MMRQDFFCFGKFSSRVFMKSNPAAENNMNNLKWKFRHYSYLYQMSSNWNVEYTKLTALSLSWNFYLIMKI